MTWSDVRPPLPPRPSRLPRKSPAWFLRGLWGFLLCEAARGDTPRLLACVYSCLVIYASFVSCGLWRKVSRLRVYGVYA